MPPSAEGAPSTSPRSSAVNRLTAVDLFAGAGGMSVGLAAAGFKVMAAIERDPQAAETYALNHPETRLFAQDIATVDPRHLVRDRRRRLDLLAAGPPCQGFSIKGQRRANHPGNALLRECVRVATELRPRAILIENVVGMMSMAGGYHFDRLVTGLERIEFRAGKRYDVSFTVLNAAEFGVPQSRRRLFVVAVESGLRWDWPVPSLTDDAVSLWEAIADLPKDSTALDASVAYRRIRATSTYALSLRGNCTQVLNHHTKRLESLRRRRLSELKQGDDRRALPAELQAGGHETKYRRLRASCPAPTLTAHMGKDLSDFIHPFLPRTLTAREAARLQGFPDSYEFLGSQASQFTQVGNAVPVPLARALGESLVVALQRKHLRRFAPLSALQDQLAAAV